MTDVDELVRRYQDGEPIRAIASDVGLPYSAARRMLLEAGVELRRRGQQESDPPCDPFSASVTTLARKYDVTDRTVARWRQLWRERRKRDE